MKKIKKALVTLLAASVAFTAAACGNPDEGKVIGNDSTDYTGEKTEIEIWLWESGYGKQYMEKIAKAFVGKHPEYTVKLEATADSEFFGQKLPLNAELNTADLMMSVKVNAGTMIDYCEPLNDVMDYVCPGETKTIAEKLGSAVADAELYSDGKYHCLPYVSGFTGMTYNEDILADYEIPLTTDQLISLVNELVADGIVPFTHFTGGGYWDAMFQMWQGQYVGVDGIHDIYENPTLEKVTSEDNGVYEALKVLEQCLNSPKKYLNGSNAFNFTDAQTFYIEGYSAMMANGTWMEYEMSGNYEAGTKNFKMMKTPVISSIKNKCQTISDDDELACLVAAIDSGKTALIGTGYEVSQADFDRVAEARGIMYNHAIGHAAAIPNYSDNIAGAKEFLKFYYSDEALKIFADTTHAKSVFDFDGDVQLDISSWSAWQKNQYEIDRVCTPFTETGNRQHVLYTTGGLTLYAGIPFVTRLSTANEEDRLTAAEIWNNIKATIKSDWEKYNSNAGL